MPKASFVRPKIAAIEPSLIVHRVGKLSARDLLEVDRRLRQAMSLLETVLTDIVSLVELSEQPAATVQAMAEKSIGAAVSLAAEQVDEIDLERLRTLLPT